VIFLAATFVLVPALRAAASDLDYITLVDSLDAKRAWDIVNDLAGDRFEGRRAGTRGADLASEYIANYFDSIGLGPPLDRNRTAWRSAEFTVPLWQLTRMPTLALIDASGSVLQTFKYRKDFCVQAGSGAGDYSSEVVFVGYGITAKGFGYDDYAGISTHGKIALAIIGTPPSDQFKSGLRAAEYGEWYSKAENAIAHGASGLILVDNPAQPTPHYVERWRGGWTIYRELTILGGTIQMADTLLKERNLTLSSLQRRIDQDLKPLSFALMKRLHVSVEVSFTHNAYAYNVLGYILGSDPAASEKAVIIGAHYDHWGKDVDGSIFRGANDDASGVAVMMEIARVFSAAARPRWSVVFAAWSGEEEGFYGSSAYVEHPWSFLLSGTIAYLNLDMVGYGQQLQCEISEAHRTLRAAMNESAKQLHIPVDVQGFSPDSDNTPFEQNGVQNLMFIYWPDDVYHTPADTADHISEKNLLETARLTALIALKLAEATVTTITQTTATTSAQVVTGVSFTVEVLAVVGITFVILVAAKVFYSRRKQDAR
jgi:hypothetical protein